jgi:hypothetical protein
MSKPSRTTPTPDVQTQVLTSSQRRCCLCYYVSKNQAERKGQIAHLNQDRSNSDADNLVFLCLEHHDAFDSRTSQSKGYSEGEVRHYRDRMYKELGTEPSLPAHAASSNETPFEKLAPELRIVFENKEAWITRLLEPWRVMAWSDVRKFLFAFKAGNQCDGICRVERIYLRDGRVAVICTQIDENPGQSVTNSIETIAFQVCANFKIPSIDLVLIDHWKGRGPDRDEYTLVSFEQRPPAGMFEGPSWREMTEQDWKSLGLRPRNRRKKLS